MRKARGPCASRASERVVKLPSDFDIFSPPTCTIAAWIQCRENAWPGALGLRPLVLVVREHEVVAAAVEVEPLAEQVERHRRALDVPARPAPAPRRVPRRLTGLRRLPEREVDRVALGLVDLDAGAGGLEQLLERAVRQRAVRRERRDVEVDTAALAVDGVGVATVDELPDRARASARCTRSRAAVGRAAARGGGPSRSK